MTGIVSIISLLPILCTEYQETRLISQLNNFFHFDHNVLLLDSSADTNRFTNKAENVPQSLYIFRRAGGNISGLDTLTRIKSKNTFMIVVLESGEFKSNLDFLNQLMRIQRLQIKMKIGMFFPQYVSIDDLRHTFNWCKEHQIIDIFAAAYAHREVIQEPNGERPITIFTFEPFGTFNVVNVTGDEFNNYFRSYNSNFQQHRIRLAYTFAFSFNEEFWLTVFRLMNASFIEEQNNYTGTKPKKFFENGIDIIPRLDYIQYNHNYVYPLVMLRTVIIVPEALPYAEFSSFLLAIISNEFIGYSLITIAAVMLLLTIFRYIKQRKILVFQSVADVFNLLMNDNGYIKYQRLSRIESFLIVPLTFVGFIIVNGFMSNLQSYLTRPVTQPEINTLEDIYSSPFPIFTYVEDFKIILINILNNRTNEDWGGKVFMLPIHRFMEEFYSYNTSNSYSLDLINAEFALKTQKRLNIRGFRASQRLNEISFRIQSAGLWDLWWRRSSAYFENDILELNLKRLEGHKETEIEKLPIPMFIVCGWLASIVVLVIEIVWKNWKISQFLEIVRKKCGQFYRSLGGKFGR